MGVCALYYLVNYSDIWTIQKVKSKGRTFQKVPAMMLIVKMYCPGTGWPSRNGTMSFKDETGELDGTVHVSVHDAYGHLLSAGSVIYMVQVGGTHTH